MNGKAAPRGQSHRLGQRAGVRHAVPRWARAVSRRWQPPRLPDVKGRVGDVRLRRDDHAVDARASDLVI